MDYFCNPNGAQSYGTDIAKMSTINIQAELLSSRPLQNPRCVLISSSGVDLATDNIDCSGKEPVSEWAIPGGG